MRKVNKLYKLAREILFEKHYYCIQCNMINYDKHFMRNHIKIYHDEWEMEMRMFRCKRCYKEMDEKEILAHEC